MSRIKNTSYGNTESKMTLYIVIQKQQWYVN